MPSRTHGGPSTERAILLEALLYALLSLILVAELTRDGDNLYSIHFTDSVLYIHLSIPLIAGARFPTTPLPLVTYWLWAWELSWRLQSPVPQLPGCDTTPRGGRTRIRPLSQYSRLKTCRQCGVHG
ncbi:hypothetical protein H4582DRAFT_2011826 [Lactarius indigo]|nr:hypothetical protein H4582DRAFT_2011826 [Lactarius indigo]